MRAGSFVSFFLASLVVGALGSLVAAGPGTANDFGGRRVLVIGIDGLRPDLLKRCVKYGTTPALKSLIDSGTVTWNAFAGGVMGKPTQQATLSGPGWASILTGVWTDRHHVSNNTAPPPNEPATYDSYVVQKAPHFAVRIKAAKPDASICSISSWAWIATHFNAAQPEAFEVNERGIGVNYAGRDLDVRNKAITCLKERNPDVLFVHFDQADGAGHATGFSRGNPAYLEALRKVDEHISDVLAAIHQRPQAAAEKWLVLVTTDHGGIDRNHGGHTPEERTIFVIANGPGVAAGQVSTQAVGHVVIAPTVVQFLGLRVDPAWGWMEKGFGVQVAPSPGK